MKFIWQGIWNLYYGGINSKTSQAHKLKTPNLCTTTGYRPWSFHSTCMEPCQNLWDDGCFRPTRVWTSPFVCTIKGENWWIANPWQAYLLWHSGKWSGIWTCLRSRWSRFNIALFGHPSARLLPVAEIDFVDYPDSTYPILDYKAKWDKSSFEYHHTTRKFHSDLSVLLQRKLEMAAHVCFRVLMLKTMDASTSGWTIRKNSIFLKWMPIPASVLMPDLPRRLKSPAWIMSRW